MKSEIIFTMNIQPFFTLRPQLFINQRQYTAFLMKYIKFLICLEEVVKSGKKINGNQMLRAASMSKA